MGQIGIIRPVSLVGMIIVYWVWGVFVVDASSLVTLARCGAMELLEYGRTRW